MTRHFTRRQVLVSGTASLAALAGCADRDRADPGRVGTPTKMPTFAKSIEADSRNLVVTLPDRHNIERLTLVDPNGRHFATKPVQTGVTQVRFELVRIRVWRSEYLHYEPGVYELVGMATGRTYREKVRLEPDVRIVDVEQVRDEELPRQYKGLAVTVMNVGTGPTWVYDIAYTDAPHATADGELENEVGKPFFFYPERDDISPIGPEDQEIFVGPSRPLVFSTPSDCEEFEQTMDIRVGIASQEEVRQKIRLASGGEAVDYFPSGEWLCDEVSVEMIDDR